MNTVASRTPHYENVPADPVSAFTFRVYRSPSFPFHWHYHPEVEMTLIVRGQGIRFVGDSAEEFSDGDLCLLGANIPHCWASHKDALPGVSSFVIQLLPDSWGATFWNLPETRSIGQLLDRARCGLKVQGSVRGEIEQLFRFMQQQPHGSLQRVDTLLEMLHCLAGSRDSQSLATEAYQQPPAAEANGKLGRILGFIHAHLDPEMTQHEVAAAVGLSPQAFSHFFHRSLGTSYVSYVNELKIRNACRALIETDQRITEIALGAGFNNLSHFNSQFRRRRHTTPRAFRRQVQSAEGVVVPVGVDGAPLLAEERSAAATVDRDVTCHGKGTRFQGVRVGTEDPRPWLKRYMVCPALDRYQMLHLGIAEAVAPYQIVRPNQTSSYFLACFEGRGRVLVDGRWQIIRPGLACLLAAHVHNAFEALAGETWRFAYVCYQQQPRHRPIASASSPLVMEFEPDGLRLAIEGLTAECRRDARPALVARWLELVHGYVLAFAHPVQPDSQWPALWERVVARLPEDWTCDALAREAGCTSDRLRRLCHKELGRSPLRQLAHLHMRRATELLTTTNLQLSAIAEAVGYPDPVVFSNAFRSSVGCRPTDYRQRFVRPPSPS
jgi:AraC-like DNA-binding protein/quercetin dioxygenase-like cupin family protein